jgi:hypothetical protein
MGVSPGWWVPAQVLLALCLCALARQPAWWYAIHVLFAPLVLLAFNLHIPAWCYLLALLLAWAVFGRIDRSRVPLYLSNAAALRAIDELLSEDGRLLDIGAGTGTVLAWLSRHGSRQLVGVEHAWLPWLVGRVRARLMGGRFTLLKADLMQWSLAGYDIVYAFLSPAAMPAVWAKAKREMSSGSLFISNSFDVPGEEADSVIELNDWKGARLYLWRMP